jgi:hypothetical protein
MAVTRKKTGTSDQRRASTETEAVVRARDETKFQKELVKALRATAGRIPRIKRVF